MSSIDLKSSDYAALAEFRYQIRRFLHFSEQASRRAGVEPQHHQLMLALRGAGGRNGCRIADLAERLQIQHHSAVELVGRLEEKDLVQRSRGAEDRREVYVSLTDRGERVLRELTFHHREELRSAAPALIAALRRVNGGTAKPAGKATAAKRRVREGVRR
jgi:DNA-binding MarR family transcriptional regulator